MGKINIVSKYIGIAGSIAGFLYACGMVYAALDHNPQRIYSDHPVKLVFIFVPWLISGFLFAFALVSISETIINFIPVNKELDQSTSLNLLLSRPARIIFSCGCIISLCAGLCEFYVAYRGGDGVLGSTIMAVLDLTGAFVFCLPFTGVAETACRLLHRHEVPPFSSAGMAIIAVGNTIALAASIFGFYRGCAEICKYEGIGATSELVNIFDVWFVAVLGVSVAVALAAEISLRRFRRLSAE